MKETIENFMGDKPVTLEKINSLNGKHFNVFKGDKVTGLGNILSYPDGFALIVLDNSRMHESIRTSKIKSVVYVSYTKLVFETQNSLYEIVKESVDDKKEVE